MLSNSTLRTSQSAPGQSCETRMISIIGAPVDCGSARPGCLMGPDALRTAGLEDQLLGLGLNVEDRGNLDVLPTGEHRHPNSAIHDLDRCVAWVEKLQAMAAEIPQPNTVPIFLGGDHLMSAGTVSGLARRADDAGRPLFVLWLDAHADFHTLESTQSGNLHGTSVAYFTGQDGFSPYFSAPARKTASERVQMLGLRSVDTAERRALAASAIDAVDMRTIDEAGIATPLKAFLSRVNKAHGMLHVSLDVDFLDPAIAPAVGTTVPGGATFREAHLVMEMLCDSGLVSSVDIAELNPFLDERGRTATLLVDLVASLFGKQVLGRPTYAQ